MRRQEIWLPWPPQSNTMFAMHGHKRFPSKGYMEWKELVAQHLLVQKPERMDGCVSVSILLTPPPPRLKGRPWDIDNRVKPILDALVSHKIIEDDNYLIVRKVTVEVGDEYLPGATVVVEVRA